MSKKHSGVPIRTGGSGAKETPAGGDPGVGKHIPSPREVIGTAPANAGQYDPNFGHKK